MRIDSHSNFAARMGRWSAAHRKTAIFGWLAFVLVATVLGGAVGMVHLPMDEAGAGEARRAQVLVKESDRPKRASENVLVQRRTEGASDAAYKAAIADVAATLEGTEEVVAVRSPLDRHAHGLVSADGRSALVQFDLEGDPHAAAKRIDPVLAAVAEVQKRHPDFRIEQFGGASTMKALNDTVGKDFQRAEVLALPITLAILLFAFGALVAALLPFALAVTAFLGALGIVTFASHALPVDQSAISVMLLIGLAVGVDYSLFYIRREREERAAGRSPAAALEAAAATSGRAVIVSGLTVIAAMAGMFLTGTPIFSGIAAATIIVVAVAVAGSLTVLPALLSWLGDRVDRGRVPLVRRAHRDGAGRAWSVILDRVLRRPALSAALAGGVLLAASVPALALDLNQPGADDLPRDLAIVQTYERVQKAFPGGPMPAEVVVRADDVTAPAVAEAIVALREQALATGEIREPVHVETSPDKTVAIVSLPLAGRNDDAAARQALATLREEVVPATVGGVDGLEVAVGGSTAESVDFTGRIAERAPIVFAFVLGLAFLLLLATFRSLVVAAKAIVLNLLSVGAAYGILVATFQWGWGESLLGFESTGGITAWVPLFLFVVLFGLSMDYHVFILSRVRESYDGGMRTEDAVAHAIKSTAGVVTSAAVIMVAVFAVFGTLSQVSMKQIGVGLATAVLLDATIVRAVLLPATMKLLGDWNWYLPRWLAWLPRVSAEPAAAAPVAAFEPSRS
jgi:uncharacterized membrane protein YdfJ with MMPL/SSD domain